MINQTINKDGTEGSYLIVYSLRLYKELIAQGVFPTKQMPNPKDSGFNCWVFEDCEQVRTVLNNAGEDRPKGGSNRG